jgi:hypothetical protein
MAQLLVASAETADALNTAACMGLLVCAHVAWWLGGCIAAATPWSTVRGVGRHWRRLGCHEHGALPRVVFASLVGCALLGSTLALFVPLFTGDEVGRTSPDVKDAIYLSVPGCAALGASLLLSAHGGLDPLGPTLSFGLAPTLSLAAAVVELTDPPLPDCFDADALAVLLLVTPASAQQTQPAPRHPA